MWHVHVRHEAVIFVPNYKIQNTTQLETSTKATKICKANELLLLIILMLPTKVRAMHGHDHIDFGLR